MHLIFAIGATIQCWYLLSFSKYNWRRNNKLAAVGSALLGIGATLLFYFVLFSGYYEL